MNIIKSSLQNKTGLILIISLFLTTTIFVSCRGSIQLSNEDLSEIDSFSGFYFSNYPYLTEQTNYRFPSLLDAFHIYDTPKDKVYIDFTDEDDLRLSYQNQRGKLISHIYEGKFKDNYYEIYFDRFNGGLPPIYWQTKINRMQIAFNKEGNLVLNHKYKNGKYYFFGLLFKSVTDDFMIDNEISKNRQQLFFKRNKVSNDDLQEDFRLFL